MFNVLKNILAIIGLVTSSGLILFFILSFLFKKEIIED